MKKQVALLLLLAPALILAGCKRNNGKPESSYVDDSSEYESSEVSSEDESSEEESSEEEGIAIKATTTQDWAFKDVPVFTWYWGGENTGAWKEIEYDVSGVMEVDFVVPDGTTAFLLVRCAPNTTTPNWEVKSGDAPGRIYNKTADVGIKSGTSSYAVTFIDYPEQQG